LSGLCSISVKQWIREIQLSQDTDPPSSTRGAFKTTSALLALSVAGAAYLSFSFWFSPSYSFHPLCTYTVNARVSADVEIAGQKLSSTVVYQNSRSRRWIATMNSAGCKRTHGTVLTFKLASGGVLIIPSRICHKGAEVLEDEGQLDVLTACTGKQAHQDSAFMVDSATSPRKWQSVSNPADFRIVSMTAVSTWAEPSDDIASTVPNLLKSNFKYGRNQWARSPEAVISFDRRYKETRGKPDRAFEFEVINERFNFR
jgi:hypothetical protein